jgi:pseudolysin
MKMRYSIFTLSAIALACSSAVMAAQPVNLAKQSVTSLQNITSKLATFKEIRQHADFNGTTHLRVQQTYVNHPVWNGDVIFHIPESTHPSISNLNKNSTANGTVYLGLSKDLDRTSSFAVSDKQAKLALKHGIGLHQKKTGFMGVDATKSKSDLIVYVDKKNKAHWAYHVTFLSGAKNGFPSVPTYILDAETFAVYAEWDNLQTAENVTGGGFGGNPKLGKLTYDGAQGNYPALKMSRDAGKNLCTLTNKDVEVKDDTKSSGPFSNSPVAKFDCAAKDAEHHNLYWNGDLDQTNEGYSPENDSLYIGTIVKDMYQKWYDQPVLSIFGNPLKLYMHAHAKDMYGKPMDNAFFMALTMQMYFGDGVKYFYPLTSLGVGAHELSHGFTSQHSNLTYEKQSGGLNESYSDMAAQAAEYYSTGTNSWQIGPEIVKGKGALRYMDDPTKDGKSIAHVDDYTDDLNVHYSSGVFNKMFYTLGTSKGWNTHKAFDVMVKANMDYWTANSTFADAACGVLHATKDNQYSTEAVIKAFDTVGIDVTNC